MYSFALEEQRKPTRSAPWWLSCFGKWQIGAFDFLWNKQDDALEEHARKFKYALGKDGKILKEQFFNFLCISFDYFRDLSKYLTYNSLSKVREKFKPMEKRHGSIVRAWFLLSPTDRDTRQADKTSSK